MKKIMRKIGIGTLWMLKGVAKVMLFLMYLILSAVKLFLMLFSIVFTIVFSFVRIGST